MTRIKEAGFETGGTSELSFNTGCTVDTTSPRTGKYSILAPANNYGSGFGTLSGGNLAAIYGRAAVRLAATPTVLNYALIFHLETSGAARIGRLVLRLNANGTCDLIVSNSASTDIATATGVAVNSSGYAVIEFYCQVGASGTYTVKVDGTQVLTGTGNFGTTNIAAVTHGYIGPSTSGHDVRFDDIGLDDANWIGTGNPVSYAGIGTAAEVASDSLTLTEPSGVQQNDVLIAAIAYRSNAAFTLPSGWSLIATQDSNGNTTVNTTGSIVSVVAAYIVRGASAPDLTFVRTGGNVARGAIMAIRANSAPIYDTGSTVVLSSASSTTDGTAITTAVAEEFLVMGAFLARNTTATGYVAATEPSAAGWTEVIDTGTATGADTAIAIAYAKKGPAGSTGIPSYTALSARNGIILGAFKSVAVYNQSVSATVAGTVTRLKQAGKIVSATSTGVVTHVKAISKRVTVTSAAATTVVKQARKTISAVSSSVSTVVKRAGKIVSSSVLSTVNVSFQNTKTQIVSAVVASSVSIPRAISKTISVVSSTVVTRVNSVGKTIAITSASIVSLPKNIGKVVSVISTMSVLAAATRVVMQSISAVVSSSTTVSRSIAKQISVVSGTVTTVVKSTMKTISATLGSSVFVVRRAGVVINASVSIVVGLSRLISKTLSVAASMLVEIARASSVTWFPINVYRSGVWVIGRLKIYRGGMWVKPHIKRRVDGEWVVMDD